MNNLDSIANVPTTSASPASTQPPQVTELRINEARAVADYVNFCRVTGTPEELLIDCGFALQPRETAEPIRISQRVITSWITAKRLVQTLQTVIARHESAFGVLETNIQERVRRS